MNNEIQSNSIVFAGPFMGEFGWELSHWMPHVRWLRNQYKGRRLVVSSYPGRHPLYYGIADEFVPLPEWFTEKKYDCDCFEALSENGHYEKLLLHFKEHFKNAPNLLWSKTPRGMNPVLRNMKHVIFDRLHQSDEADKIIADMIDNHGGKPVIAIFARSMVNRRMFLDVTYNKAAYVEDWYPNGLPSRNWSKSNWEDLFEMLYARYSKQFTFVIGGTRSGNCLWDKVEKYPDVIDLSQFDISKSLDVTIGILNKAFMSISSQSGPTHLSVQCGCPSFVYGHEMERHTIVDNPLKTDMVFYPTQLDAYNDLPQNLFKEISVYIHQLSVEKHMPFISDSLPNMVKEKPKRIRKIGIIGVLDNPNSTNIPFAKAFIRKNFSVEAFNYRTVAAQIGVEAMNLEIERFAAKFDLIIICKGNGVNPETIERISKVTKVCFYMMDAKCHLDSDPTYYEMAKAATFSVVTTGEVKCALIGAGIKNVNHILQGVDPNQFKPTDFTEKLEDVVFIGQATEKRNRIIDSLKSSGIPIYPYGPGYGSECYGDAFNIVCSHAKVLLAINNTDSDQDSFSDRTLRYLATKGCVVTEYSKVLEKYFQNGVHLAWPESEQTIVEVIRYYLDHPKMAEQMAERGYQHVMANYTWDKVAERIIQIAENPI